MKTLQLPLAFLCIMLATIYTANAHSPPVLALADTIAIQFHTGYGADCHGSGRQCLSAQTMTIGQSPAALSQAVAKAWFDGNGHFVMEVRQIFDTRLWNELQGGTFYLEASVPLSGSLMASLGKDGQAHTLPPGVHLVKKQQDGSYQIIF